LADTYYTAAIWIALALVASVVSIRVGISVALVEIGVGVLGGNLLSLHSTPWIDFLASFGSVLLTFLAGAEIDPDSFRRHLKAGLAIGIVSFLLPFLAAMAFAYFAAGWDLRAAEIAGVALSTTSVAVVYAVMVETGLNRTDLGKLILAACFVTDLGTVIALGLLFASFGPQMLLFLAVSGLVLWQLPVCTRFVLKHWGGRVSEPEVKFLFLVLFGLGALAASAGSEAVLPAYVAGLVVAGVFYRDKAAVVRMRAIAFTMLTPFYFLKAGLFVSLPAVASAFGLVVTLLTVKVGAKVVGVWPMSVAFGLHSREASYTTLLMSTGLTFGSISALYGLTHGIIQQSQYSVLVTVVIASAVVPTVIAQSLFRPRPWATAMSSWARDEVDAEGAEDGPIPDLASDPYSAENRGEAVTVDAAQVD
jgi:Kef-type K+ transport system membrane component KefB